MILYPPLSLSLWQEAQKKKYDDILFELKVEKTQYTLAAGGRQVFP